MRSYVNNEFIFNDFFHFISLFNIIALAMKSFYCMYFRNKKFTISPMKLVIKFDDEARCY